MNSRPEFSLAKLSYADEKIHYAFAPCLSGVVLVAQTNKGICAILLADNSDSALHELNALFSRANLIADDKQLNSLVATVKRFIMSPQYACDIPLDSRGTAFQQRVWKVLCDIPPGKTLSYSELAKKIGAPKSVRAVANACAANRLAVVIPCHRVVRSNGDLSGYRWGIERKRELLLREKPSDC